MADNVEIRITGSVDGSLPASTAAAQAAVAELGASVAASSVAMKAGVSAMNDTLVASTARYFNLGNALKDIPKSFNSISDGLRTLGAGFADEAAHMGRSRAVTEGLVTVHEALQRRFSRIPGTLMIMAQSMTGASTGMLLLGAAAVVAIGGLVYLEYEALKAKKNLDDLTAGFALTGRGAEMNAEAVKYDLEFLAKLPGSSSDAANAFMHLAATHADWSRQLINETGQLMPAFIQTYGKDAPQALGKLTEELSNLTESGFEKLDRSLLNLKPEEYELIANLIKTGDTAKATSLILADLSRNSGVYIKSLGDQVYDAEQQIARLQRRAAEGLLPNLGAKGADSLQTLNEWKDKLAEIRREEANVGPEQVNNQYKDELNTAEKINEVGEKRVTITAQIVKLQNDLADAQKRGDATGAATFTQAIMAEQTKLTKFDKQQNDEQFRNFSDREDAEADASKRGAQARITAAEHEVAEAKKLFGDESDEYLRAVGKMNAAKLAQTEVAQAADKHANTEFLAELTKSQSEVNQIRNSDVSSQLSIAKIGLEQQKSVLDDEVAEHRITAARKYEILADLAQQEAALDIRQLSFEQSLYADDIVAYNNYANKIKEIRAQLGADLAQYAAAGSRAEQQEVTKQTKAWLDANREVMASEDQFINGLFSGRQRLSVLLVQGALNLAEKEIETDAKYWTERALLSLEGVNSENAAEKGGVLMNLLFSKEKLVNTQATETQKTAAVVAGESARTAAQVTGKTAGLAAQATTASASIANDAKQAAAGTYAAVAQIPVVGPVLAPVAAAGAFAAVMAFDTLTSAEGGQYSVPYDNQITALHVNEQVLPAPYASGLRDLIASRGGVSGNAGGAGPGGPSSSVGGGMPPVSIGVSTLDARSFSNFLNNPANMRLLTARMSAAMGLNPSYRPSY